MPTPQTPPRQRAFSLATAVLLVLVPVAIIAGTAAADPLAPLESGENRWQQIQHLQDSNPEEDDWFGSSVAIDGDVMVVGHQQEDDEALAPTFNHGAVTVFERSASGEWALVETFTGDSHHGWFGQLVAIDGERFVTTAPSGQGSSTFSTCELYVYEKTDGEWGQAATLAADVENDCALGGSNYPGAHAMRALALDGDLLVVGVPEIIDGAPGPQFPGEVLVYRHTSSGWTLETSLSQPVDPDAFSFGRSVAISEASQRIAVANGTDKIFLFKDSPEGWQHTETLETLPLNAKGLAMSEDGTTIVTRGTPRPVSTGKPVEVFEETADGWTRTTLLPKDEVDAEVAVASVAIDGDRIVLGAPHDDRSRGGAAGLLAESFDIFVRPPCVDVVAPCPKSGSAYIFDRVDGAWTQTTKLVPDDVDRGSWLGWDVDVSGDTVVAGAPFEDSDRQVQPDPSTSPVDRTEDVGGAYVFSFAPQQGPLDEVQGGQP